MGRAKRLKNLRKQVEAIQREAMGDKPDPPVKSWWHRLPIIGDMLYRRRLTPWWLANRIKAGAIHNASRRTYQKNK